MTSGFKSRARTVMAVLVLALPLALFAQESRMQRGDLTIGPDQTAGDVVAADGDLVVRGKVEGAVFVVKGDVFLEPGSRVEGAITVLGGDLWVKKGAAAAGEINVFSGAVHLDDGASVGAEVRALAEVSSLTPEKLEVISRYLIFDRPVPPPEFPLEGLEKLDARDLHLRQESGQAMASLDLFELGKLPLDPGQIQDSREIVYRGRFMTVRVAAARFNTAEQAEAFWDRLRDDYEEKTNYSVHNGLAGGAHWFFHHQRAAYAMWRNGPTFMAVMVRTDDDDPSPALWKWIERTRDRVIAELPRLWAAAPANHDQGKDKP